MKERPILFSAPMVRALLAGAKTQTRRIVKPQPPIGHAWSGWCVTSTHRADEGKATWATGTGPFLRDVHRVACPYGQPGDRLWVKENWSTGARLDDNSPKAIERACRDAGYTHGACCPVRYQADGSSTQWGDRDADDFGPWGKTRVSIHMPRWASRLTLEIVSVRVERLNDISEADAQAEGIERVGGEFRYPDEMKSHCAARSRSYMTLWESINGAGSWAANPWVWAVEFRRADGKREVGGDG